MKIRRVILKGVRNFKDFDRSFEDSWNGKIPGSLVLIGPNGSGKTTLLNVISGLWQLLNDALIHEKNVIRPSIVGVEPSILTTIDSSLASARLAAIEIIEFLNAPPFWLFAGSDPIEIKAFNRAYPQALRIGRLYEVDKTTGYPSWSYTYLEPGASKGQSIDVEDETRPSWYSEWRERLVKNVYGKNHDLPNIVFLESETRLLLPVNDSTGMTPEPDEFQWLSRYEPGTSRKGSLQNYLFGLKAVNPDVYDSVIQQVNAFLVGKKLADFSPRSYELMVQVGEEKHRAVDLSSGEKQVLLMLVTILRRLEPGGIVLIDEPDLHLHVSLMNAFVSHLRRLVEEKKGQLILASHSPELWREFTDSQTVRLGKVDNGETSHE